MLSDEIKRDFVYDWTTGRLLRIRKTDGGLRSPVKKTHGGYYVITWKHGHYREHRLIWAYFNDQWPVGVIDHIDRDKTNNRIENLRDVPNWLNLQNRDANKNSSTGIKGVFRDGNKWRYQFEWNGIRYSGRGFETIDTAAKAREFAYSVISARREAA